VISNRSFDELIFKPHTLLIMLMENFISTIYMCVIVTSIIVTTKSSSVTAGSPVTFTCRVSTVGRGNLAISWINDNPRNITNTQVNEHTKVSTDTLTVNRASQISPAGECEARIGNSDSRSHFVRLTVTGTL